MILILFVLLHISMHLIPFPNARDQGLCILRQCSNEYIYVYEDVIP